jgi:UDP-glucose 6-dehydrogenase
VPDREPIGVIGAGWVGLVTAACFADLGHEVHCRDIVPEKVDALRRGEVPIFEPGLADLLERNRERLHFTTDMGEVLSGAELLFCCVDTPPTYSGDADLSRVESVVRELGESRDHAIVMKSTVPVGTGRSIRRSRDIGYVSNPEFLQEGSAVSDFMNPDRVVVGTWEDSDEFGDRVVALYEPLEAPIVRTDVASAEMIKLASNAFLATKISFINEIANVSEELGADVTEVARGMGLDERIGTEFLRAGIGYGGSCLVGEETVLVRRKGRVRMRRLDELFDRVAAEQDLDASVAETIEPDGLEVLSWREGESGAEFLPVELLTRRDYSGHVVEVSTAGGHSVTATADHPFCVAGDGGTGVRLEFAAHLRADHHLPIVRELDSLNSCPRYRVENSSVVVAEPRLDLLWEPVAGAARRHFVGSVYSMEVPGSHTFVTGTGLVCHNCFPKDVSALKQLAGNSGYHFQLLTAVIEVNELQKRRTIGKLQKHLGALVGKQIALLGVAFKPNTDDVREATSLVLAARLQSEGANVRVYDPKATDRARELLGGVQVAASALDALTGADAAVLVTEWREFRELDWAGEVKERMARPILVDGRNFLDAELLTAAGYTVEGIGRSAERLSGSQERVARTS